MSASCEASHLADKKVLVHMFTSDSVYTSGWWRNSPSCTPEEMLQVLDGLLYIGKLTFIQKVFIFTLLLIIVFMTFNIYF